MKKHMVLTIALLLGLSVVLTGCSSSPPPLAEGLKPPILQDVERVPVDPDAPFGSAAETVTPSSQTLSGVLNSSAKKLLEVFGVSYDPDGEVEKVFNPSYGEEITYRAKSKDVTIETDKYGNLSFYYDYDRRTHDDTQPQVYKTAEDCRELIAAVEDALDLSGYRVRAEMSDILGLEIYLEKEVGNGLCNSYDMLWLCVDPVTGQVSTYANHLEQYKPNTAKALVTEEQALQFALTEVETWERVNLAVTDAEVRELTYVRPNFKFEGLDNDVRYEQADFIRLAWKVHVEDTTGIGAYDIWVDAETGEILGGSVYR